MLSAIPMSVLVISDLFPNPTRPTHGTFVADQVSAMRQYCRQIVVAPVRVFPGTPFRYVFSPRRFGQELAQWHRRLDTFPSHTQYDEVDVFYQPYLSLPRVGFRGTWGHTAYWAMSSLLHRLHRLHHFDLIHAHVASPAGVAALRARTWMHAPVVVSVHGADIHYTLRQNRFSANIVREVFRNADHVVANSGWTARHILENGGASPRVSVIHLGGNLPLHADPTLAIPAHASFRILTVGRLVADKGHALVLRALQRLRQTGCDISYTIVGDGPEMARLQQLANDLGVTDHVQFEGFIPHDELIAYYLASDLFVMPSEVEGFGVVFVEALSQGVPAIGCAGTGGPEELAALGECIKLVEPRNLDQLVAAIRALYDDDELRRTMGAVGRHIVANDFTWERNAAKTFELYTRLVSTNA